MKRTKIIRVGMGLVFMISLLLCGFWSNYGVSAAQISSAEIKETQKPTLPNGIPGIEGADVFISEEWLDTVTAQAGDDELITEIRSSQLNVTHSWEIVIEDRSLTVSINNETGVENADVMIRICQNNDQNTVVAQKWGSLSGRAGSVTLDMSDTTVYPDGIYKMILFEDIKNDGQVWSIASYLVQIVDGVISFAPGAASSLEQAFIDNLNKNYNPDLYDEIPLKYYPEEANTRYYHYSAENLDDMIAKAQTLTANCKTDEQKVKAIHDWVCEEFAYDYEALKEGDYNNQADAEWVFKNKRAVCSGFSRMSQILLTSVGVPCMNVVGYADGGGITSSDIVSDSNHEWNVVYLNGSWEIMDFTWDCENRYYGSYSNDETPTTSGNAPSYTYYGITPFCYGMTHCSQELPGEMYGSYFTDFYVEKLTLQNTPTAEFDLNDTFSGNYQLVCELSDGSKLTRTVDGTVCASGYDMSKNGYQMLTVSYGGKSLKYEILVGTGCTEEHVIAEWIVIEPANCTSLGLKNANCTKCNKYHEDVASATPVHNVQSETITLEPTCTTEGEKQGICVDCKETIITTIDVVDHTYAESFTIDKETSCTEKGSKSRHCKWYDKCNMITEQTDIPTIDHDYDDGIITTVPTCYSEGERTRTCSMCKGTTTEEVAKVDHEYETSYTIDKAPSCKEEGSKSYHCVWYSQCETSQGAVVLEKTDDHDYDGGVVTTAPTCTTEGEKTFTCFICEGTRTEDVATVDHDYDTAYTVDKAPSCKEEGSQSYHCKWYAECGELIGATVIEKTDDHSYDEGVVTKAPTCTTVGDRTLTCEICEGTKVIDEPTVPHEYETTYTVDKTPSCKEEGSKSYHCIWYAECGLGSQVTAIEKTNDHDYDEGVVTTEPTCSTEGVKTFTCAICDGTRTEAVDIVSHNYEEDFTVDVEATCVEEGSESRHCVWYELCSESIEETVIAKNDNHSFNEGEVTIPSSCTKEGVRTFTCVRCLDTKTGPEPLKPHSYDEGVVTKTPTCTVEGERTFTCEGCAGNKVEPVEMVAHEYDTDFTVDKEATCTTNGSKSKHCKVCDSKTDMTAIQAAGHVAGEWIVDKEPTYEESGSRHKECSVCHTVVESESIDKLVAKKGATVAVGGANYSISSSSEGKNTVTYAGPQDKSVATVSVPSTIQIGSETYKVTTISANAFANCKQLKTVKIGKNVTKVGKNAFSGCTKLSKVTLPSKLTVIESGAFANCRSLKSITIPASVKKIGSKAFYKCKKLKKITIKTTKLKSSTVGKKAFSGVHQKAKVKVPKKKLKAYKKFLKKKGLPKKATIKK